MSLIKGEMLRSMGLSLVSASVLSSTAFSSAADVPDVPFVVVLVTESV